jgi:hypothetical protein
MGRWLVLKETNTSYVNRGMAEYAFRPMVHALSPSLKKAIRPDLCQYKTLRGVKYRVPIINRAMMIAYNVTVTTLIM